MNRLPKGHKAQIAGLRVLQTMYTAEQLRKEIAKEREACAKLIEVAPCECCWPESSMPITEKLAAAIRARGQAKDEMPLFDDWGKKW